MAGCIKLGCKPKLKLLMIAGRPIVAAAMLASCSSVPDAVNPVEWYKGGIALVTGKESDVPKPAPPKGEYPDVNKMSQAVPKTLAADRGNSKYAEPVRRDGTPTKALARKNPLPAETQVAKAAPLVPPAPIVVQSELPPTAAVAAAPTPAKAAEPRLSPDRPTAMARADMGPDAPPASMNYQPPGRPDIPENVPLPSGKGRPKILTEQYNKRLAESAQQTVRPGIVDMPQTTLASASSEEEPIHLIPPRGKHGGGRMPVPAPQERLPAASFQVAALEFRGASTELTGADRESLAEVARLYKQTGGVVRILASAPGYSQYGNDSSSLQRANAVARELARRGVPTRKIMVAADSSSDSGALIYLDVM